MIARIRLRPAVPGWKKKDIVNLWTRMYGYEWGICAQWPATFVVSRMLTVCETKIEIRQKRRINRFQNFWSCFIFIKVIHICTLKLLLHNFFVHLKRVFSFLNKPMSLKGVWQLSQLSGKFQSLVVKMLTVKYIPAPSPPPVRWLVWPSHGSVSWLMNPKDWGHSF